MTALFAMHGRVRPYHKYLRWELRTFPLGEPWHADSLPERLADPPRISLAVRYQPGTEGIAVGGDWYDVFDLGENRIGIALGDVVGKGIGAAAVMGRLRNVLRAFAAGPAGRTHPARANMSEVAGVAGGTEVAGP